LLAVQSLEVSPEGEGNLIAIVLLVVAYLILSGRHIYKSVLVVVGGHATVQIGVVLHFFMAGRFYRGEVHLLVWSLAFLSLSSYNLRALVLKF